MATDSVYENAFLYYYYSTTIYNTYYLPLYELYNETFWPQAEVLLNQPWVFPTVSIVFTAANLILVSF